MSCWSDLDYAEDHISQPVRPALHCIWLLASLHILRAAWQIGVLEIRIILINFVWLIEGSLEVKLPTIWTDEKQSRAEAERRERLEERRSEKRKSQKKEDADARKGGKVAKHCVFPMIWGSGWSKSRLAKAAGAEPAGQMRDEKLHAVVAQSTFPNQNVQNTPCSNHFWKLWCRKSARRCGAKHISKSKSTKHFSVGLLLEVEMLKKSTPLWREAHFHNTTTTTTQLHNYTPLHSTLLHYTTLHYVTLHYTPLHYNYNYTTTLHYTPLY